MKGIASVRAAWWAQRAARAVRDDLKADGLDHLVVLPPPALPHACRRRVVDVLRVRRDTCLVRSAVLQEWDLAHGRPRDLIIGVSPPGPGFRAHAWLDGDPPAATDGLDEFTRRPPRPRPGHESSASPPGGPPAGDERPSAHAGGRQPVQQEGKVGPGS